VTNEISPEPVPDPEYELELRANKCLLRNGFEMLTFDFTFNADSPAWAWCEFMIPISRASLQGLRRLVVKFTKPICKARYPETDGLPDLEYARTRIDEISRLTGRETNMRQGAKTVFIWTWEREDGKPLECHP